MDYSLNGQYYKGDWVLIGYNLLYYYIDNASLPCNLNVHQILADSSSYKRIIRSTEDDDEGQRFPEWFDGMPRQSLMKVKVS